MGKIKRHSLVEEASGNLGKDQCRSTSRRQANVSERALPALQQRQTAGRGLYKPFWFVVYWLNPNCQEFADTASPVHNSADNS